MTLVNVLPWIAAAHRDGCGVAAFNANTMEQMQAIVLGAAAEQAPVIMQVSHRAMVYAGSGDSRLGMEYLAAIGKVAASSVDVPVSLHLDHATEQEVIQAIDLGFTSVMFDGHDLEPDANAEVSARLAERAREAGVCSEAEIGTVPKPDGAELDPADLILTTPDEAASFVEQTGVDLLAVAVGAVHGMTVKSASLDLPRLEAIRDRVSTPLVSHGSSGLSMDDLRAGIGLGLAKVNIGTEMSKAFTAGLRERLGSDDGVVDPRKYLGPARDAQQAAVCEWIRFVGASGRANAA